MLRTALRSQRLLARGSVRPHVCPRAFANMASGQPTAAKNGSEAGLSRENVKLAAEMPPAAAESPAWTRNLRGEPTLNFQRSNEWWTGLSPKEAPGMCKDGKFRSLAQPNLSEATRQDFLDYFDNTWTMQELLYSSLNGEEAFYRPPEHGLRHPMIFYYGHVAAFYVNKLRVAGLLQKAIDPYLELTFQVGVDEMSWDSLSNGETEWPSVPAVHEYRKKVYKTVRCILETHPDIGKNNTMTWESPIWALIMGMEHDRIHLETSSVLMRELPACMLRRPAEFPEDGPSLTPGLLEAQRNSVVAHSGGSATIGVARDHPSYAWDNEYGSKQLSTGAFESHECQASNAEFLEFVRDGGYADHSLWTVEGWAWRTYRNTQHPHFWLPTGPNGLHSYKLRTLFEEVEMKWDYPVILNLHEGVAYCNWLSRKHGMKAGGSTSWRLPTETEHRLMREQGADPAFSSGEDMLDAGMNSQFAYSSESSVQLGQKNSNGFCHIFGNVWEWGTDHFSPLPGFKPHKFYDDFSTPCFDGQHNVIFGGSFASTGNEASDHCRFHFRPHFHQHAGIRPTRSVIPGSKPPLTCEDHPGPFRGESVCCSALESLPNDAAVPTQRVVSSTESGLGAPAHSTIKAVPSSDTRSAGGNVDAQGKSTTYETDKMVAMYLNMHFGMSDEILGGHAMASMQSFDSVIARNWPERCAEMTIQAYRQYGQLRPEAKALDIGCAVGRSTFDLAGSGVFSEAVGVDYSRAFIDAANHMKKHGSMSYDRVDEADITTRLNANYSDTDARDKSHFLQCAAPDFPSLLHSFDAVLMANLLCRLTQPRNTLEELRRLSRPGGVVVFCSPFSWLPEFTDREEWIGGHAGGNRGEHVLKEEMQKLKFSLVEDYDAPLLIREHARKYQYIVSKVTVFRNDN